MKDRERIEELEVRVEGMCQAITELQVESRTIHLPCKHEHLSMVVTGPPCAGWEALAEATCRACGGYWVRRIRGEDQQREFVDDIRAGKGAGERFPSYQEVKDSVRRACERAGKES